MDDVSIIIVISAAGLFTITMVIALVHRVQKKRRGAFEELGKRLGFNYRLKGGKSMVKELPILPLFNPNRMRQVRHFLSAPAGATLPIAIFDFTYLGMMNRSGTTQTVALLLKPGLGLPMFELHPRGLVAKIGEKLGAKSIDFPGNPDFMEIYELRSEDEAAVRRVFTGSLLDFLARNPRFTLEASGPAAAFYRHGRTCKTVDLKGFIETASSLFSLLL
jgi:hypothetical protein